MKRYYLGIDNGTTGTTALLLDENWEQAGRGYCPLTQVYPADGWVEQDAEEIWRSVLAAVEAACRDAGAQPQQIACLGLDNVGETVVLWDRRSGKPLCNAIVWQDRRTAKTCDAMKEEHGDFVMKRAGVHIDPYFSATKIRWMLDHVDGAREKLVAGDLLAGTMDAWLFWNMTRGALFATDFSTASRTLLMNLHTGQWDDGLLDLFGVPKPILPEIRGSAGLYGYTDPDVFLGVRIPIAGGIVDQQAALFGHACFTPGMAKCTYGTGCFLLMNTGSTPIASPHGLLTTAAWQLDGKKIYALDGGVYVAGAAIQWLRDKLKIIENTAQTEQMAVEAGSSGGVYFVPAFSGLAAPHWDSYARGTMVGITGATTREHIVRAALEASAYQVKDILDAMNADTGLAVPRLRVDGGSVVNRFLMQFQADLLGIPIDVPQITEVSALGAAYLGAVGAGHAEPADIAANWKLARTYEPAMSEDERKTLMHKWHRAVERAKDWIEE
ncbi:MAG: glycerol kinase GlpK [Firmicutes bacterium]|nr:glycerol kinase GlpK [Bacillota bacterium]